MPELIAGSHPALLRFIRAVEIILAGGGNTRQKFAKILRPFELLMKDAEGIGSDVIGDMLAALKADAGFQSPAWDTNQILFWVNEDFSLSLSILRERPVNIFSTIADSYYGILGCIPFEFRRLHMPPSCDREIFDSKQVLDHIEDTCASPGSTITLLAGRDVIDWDVKLPIMLLRYSSKISENLQWAYEKFSYRPLFVSAAQPEATQLACIASFLGASRHRAALPALEELLSHPSHQVRWTSIRSICAIDRDRGRSAVTTARGDAHPHVRQAAALLLRRL